MARGLFDMAPIDLPPKEGALLATRGKSSIALKAYQLDVATTPV